MSKPTLKVPSKYFIKKYNLTTAQDLNMWSKGWVKQDLPDNLKHHSLSQYSIDNVLMIDVVKVRNTYYVHKDNLNDLKCVWKDISPLFLRVSKRKEWQSVQDFSIN